MSWILVDNSCLFKIIGEIEVKIAVWLLSNLTKNLKCMIKTLKRFSENNCFVFTLSISVFEKRIYICELFVLF